jgi:hypothetical protein
MILFKAANALREIAKDIEIAKIEAGAGAIPPLVDLLSSKDTGVQKNVRGKIKIYL